MDLHNGTVTKTGRVATAQPLKRVAFQTALCSRKRRSGDPALCSRHLDIEGSGLNSLRHELSKSFRGPVYCIMRLVHRPALRLPWRAEDPRLGFPPWRTPLPPDMLMIVGGCHRTHLRIHDCLWSADTCRGFHRERQMAVAYFMVHANELYRFYSRSIRLSSKVISSRLSTMGRRCYIALFFSSYFFTVRDDGASMR